MAENLAKAAKEKVLVKVKKAPTFDGATFKSIVGKRVPIAGMTSSDQAEVDKEVFHSKLDAADKKRFKEVFGEPLTSSCFLKVGEFEKVNK